MQDDVKLLHARVVADLGREGVPVHFRHLDVGNHHQELFFRLLALIDQLAQVIQRLSPERLQRYFDPKGPGRWAIKAPIKSRVEFRSFNLLDSYAALGKFDIVFCRNVLIYFSAEVKKDILLRIHSTLKPGGYLFLGASEALNGLPDHYQMVQCSPGIIYQAK